ncbi:putative FBD-associated F-box protein At5g56440 [Lotus japonicus]|uniref:putative FBD-associated F-box protein At5g56440 n=1 Tax=Lotus japonicus TaxID=34305 RepID=UPI00258501F1|nr:putative FBD-associated F-box protein At5g56440 [Lotus japonicus]
MADKISILPEAVLCHILSFLPTKQAVATSVLSKTWNSLWRSVLTLDFEYIDYIRSRENYARFVQSVNAVIHSRDLHQPIQKLRLTLNARAYDSTSITKCINVAVQRRLQHLDLDLSLSCHHPINLSSIFTCTTLVVLKLHGLELKPFPAVDLPFLKILHLERLSFSGRRCLSPLLSGCPVLEDFKARNLVFGSFVIGQEFKTLPKLVRVDISIPSTYFLLRIVYNNVEFLRIYKMEVMHYIRDGEGRGGANVFPKFHNLTHIELVYRNCITAKDWLQVVELLKHCPKLQVLVIDQPRSHGVEFDGIEEVGDWQYPPSVPECILLHLNRCYLKDYIGTKGEFQFARYIMQNGRSLKRMTLCCGVMVNQHRKLKMLDQLSSCTRSSTTCKLSFK